MFYVIRPDLTFGWVNFLSKQMLDEHGVDLNEIKWDPAERAFDEVTLRVGFRYGYAVAQGIALSYSDLLPLDELRKALELQTPKAANLPNEDLMEALAPGWKAETKRLDDAIDQSHGEHIDRKRAEFLQNFGADVKPELVEHWRNLGGYTPATL